MSERLFSAAADTGAVLRLALRKFLGIEGAQRSAAFAYSAFFSLFPLVILLVTAASFFIDRGLAGKAVIGFVERYVPLSGDMQGYIFNTIAGVVKARRQAGTAAFLMLVWAATQFFTALVHAANRAWGTEGTKWWHMPLKSLAMLGLMMTAALLGIGLPVLGKVAKSFLPDGTVFNWLYSLSITTLPWLVVFFSLILFYKLAPRRPTRISEVWPSALVAAALLHAAQTLFVLYLRTFPQLNAVYGAFGGIIALLMWIYLSGCIFIFCACLCAAQAEFRKTRIPAVSAAGGIRQ